MIGQRAAGMRRHVDDPEVAIVPVFVPRNTRNDKRDARPVLRDCRRGEGDDPAQVVRLDGTRSGGAGARGAKRSGDDEADGSFHEGEMRRRNLVPWPARLAEPKLGGPRSADCCVSYCLPRSAGPCGECESSDPRSGRCRRISRRDLWRTDSPTEPHCLIVVPDTNILLQDIADARSPACTARDGPNHRCERRCAECVRADTTRGGSDGARLRAHIGGTPQGRPRLPRANVEGPAVELPVS